MALVYDDLREIAGKEFQRERSEHTLQPTAVVNEVYLRLVKGQALEANDRRHFLAIAAQVIRRVLVDYSRDRGRQRRGGGYLRVELADDVLELQEAAPDFVDLDRALTQLAELDSIAARVVELKYFGGLTIEETASEIELSKASVSRKWTFARAWMFQALAESPPDPE